jgi:hypothetical protein
MNLSQKDRTDSVMGAPWPDLSKTDFLLGLQCPKLLWTTKNSKNQIPDDDAATQAAFDQGLQVGELGKMLFPEGHPGAHRQRV